MGLGDTFSRAIVREIGRNYGKAISNSLLGDKHYTPVKMVGGNLGAGSGGRKYIHQLDKLCQEFIVKGPTATFNQAQNIYYAFFDLVDQAKKDNHINLSETAQLMTAFVQAHKTFQKIVEALNDMGKKDLSEKADELDGRFFEFFVELNDDFVLPDRPTGWFKDKQKKAWDYAKKIKEDIQKWSDDYKQYLEGESKN